MVINLIDVKQILKPILDKVDHTYLNDSLKEELEGHISTVEILAYVLFKMVQNEMEKYNLTAKIDNVRLYETDKNYADYSDNL
jgi:6-pyruvoyl-tetrahydropterin synthase